MTWKKTKVMRLLHANGEKWSWLTVKTLRPYKERNYKAKGLPPGWQRMCKEVGLRPDNKRKRSAKAWLHLKGAGRRWRCTQHMGFHVSCRHANFDRWANSFIHQHPLPRNKTELELYVRFTTYDT
jgi:hypothetical protein